MGQVILLKVQGRTLDNLPEEYTEEQYKIYETIGGTPFLDMNYTVFGEGIEGLDVIDKITEATVDRRNRPKEDIKMTLKIVKK